MAYLREQYTAAEISPEALELLLASWRGKSRASYDSLFGKWASWCVERDVNPISGPIGSVVNFLAELYHQGYQYQSLNAYRSAISSVHEKVDGVPVGQHTLVSKLLKGVFNSRPPLPRYTAPWDVSRVTSYISCLGDNDKLPLPIPSQKLVMLLSLTLPTRAADVVQLDLARRQSGLSKQSRPGRVLREFFFPAFTQNGNLCPVQALRAYETRTDGLRSSSQLLVSTIKPHKPIASCSVARWLRSLLEKVGIDVSIFKAHSIRGAATSKASMAGIITTDILNAADWTSETVFQKFYYRPSRDTGFGEAVLAPSLA